MRPDLPRKNCWRITWRWKIPRTKPDQRSMSVVANFEQSWRIGKSAGNVEFLEENSLRSLIERSSVRWQYWLWLLLLLWWFYWFIGNDWLSRIIMFCSLYIGETLWKNSCVHYLTEVIWIFDVQFQSIFICTHTFYKHDSGKLVLPCLPIYISIYQYVYLSVRPSACQSVASFCYFHPCGSWIVFGT